METMETILKRRSIRKYTDEGIEDEAIRQICAAGLAAASGRGIRPVNLVVVRDREKLVALSKSRELGSAMLAGANAAIVVIASDEVSVTWIEDASVAMANMMLAATELGIGSCWVHGRDRESSDGRTTEEYVFELLGIEKGNWNLEAILSLGMPADEPPAYEIDSLDWSRVREG